MQHAWTPLHSRPLEDMPVSSPRRGAEHQSGVGSQMALAWHVLAYAALLATAPRTHPALHVDILMSCRVHRSRLVKDTTFRGTRLCPGILRLPPAWDGERKGL